VASESLAWDGSPRRSFYQIRSNVSEAIIIRLLVCSYSRVHFEMSVHKVDADRHFDHRLCIGTFKEGTQGSSVNVNGAS